MASPARAVAQGRSYTYLAVDGLDFASRTTNKRAANP